MSKSKKLCDQLVHSLQSQLASTMTGTPEFSLQQQVHLEKCRLCNRRLEAYYQARETLLTLNFSAPDDPMMNYACRFIHRLLQAVMMIRMKDVPHRLFTNQMMILHEVIEELGQGEQWDFLRQIPRVLLDLASCIPDDHILRMDTSDGTVKRWRKMVADFRKKKPAKKGKK